MLIFRERKSRKEGWTKWLFFSKSLPLVVVDENDRYQHRAGQSKARTRGPMSDEMDGWMDGWGKQDDLEHCGNWPKEDDDDEGAERGAVGRPNNIID